MENNSFTSVVILLCFIVTHRLVTRLFKKVHVKGKMSSANAKIGMLISIAVSSFFGTFAIESLARTINGNSNGSAWAILSLFIFTMAVYDDLISA